MYAIDSKTIRAVIVGAIATGLLQVAHALGLGPITVNSHIGEPLQATINVTGLNAAERAATNVSIADNEAYAKRGVEKLPNHDQLNLSLRSTGAGDYISISTPNVIREPFITFVLSVKHSGKETLREYTVFLDPATDGLAMPATTPPAVPVATAATATTSSRVELLVDQPASASSSGWKGKTPKPASASEPVRDWEGRSYGPVRKGETLFSIAEKVRPSSDYSIQTVMNQIYRANPRAFNSKQLGSLMAGYTLSIPEFTKDLVALPSSPARVSSPKAIQPQQENPTPTTSAAPQEQEIGIGDAQESDNLAVGEDASQENGMEEAESSPADGVSTDQIEIASHPIEAEEAEQTQSATTKSPSNDQTQNLSADHSGEVSVESEPTVVPAASGQISANDTNLVTGQETAPNDTANTDLVVEEQPVVETEDNQSFLTTTYAFLPVWQWLVLGVLLLGLIALLLFKQRKKHAVAEYDTLDDAEMDAVLAKINALEDDDYQVQADGDPWSEENFDGLADLDEVQTITAPQPETESDTEYGQEEDDALFDFLENEEADHKEGEAESFFNEMDDLDLNQDDSLATFDEEVGTDDDYDFFGADDEMPTRSEESIDTETDDSDWNELDIDQPTTAQVHDPVSEDDDLTFFISEDIEETEPSAVENDEGISGEDHSWPDEEVDFNDLFVSDGELDSDQQTGIDEALIDTSSDFSDSDDELLSSNEEPFATVNPDEMEINLDLAVSFIATGHGERAVVWLEEVVEVGTEEQKARAKALMDKVRGA